MRSVFPDGLAKKIRPPEVSIPIFLFLFALGFRLIYLFLLKKYYFFYDSPSADVTYYQEWAKDIAFGHWLGDRAFLGLPLYPYFLAILYRLTGGMWELVRLAHFLLGSLNCVLIYYIGKKVFNPRVGILASVLAAVNYTLIYYDWLMMPVPLLITLSLLIVLSFLYRKNLTTKREWFFVGLFLGLAVLGDGKFIFFLLFILFWAWGRRKKETAILARQILPLVLGVVFVLGISGLRYKMLTGDWIFLSTQSGLSLYAGNNPEATGVYDHPGFLRPDHFGQDQDQRIVAEAIARKSMSSQEISHFWQDKAFDFMTTRPTDAARLLVTKFKLFFTDTEWAHDMDMLFQRDWRSQWDVNPFFLMCPLAILGIFISFARFPTSRFLILRRRQTPPFKAEFKAPLSINPEHSPVFRPGLVEGLIALIISQLIFTVIFFLTTRHRATVLPFFIIFEAYALCWLIERARAQEGRKLVLAVGFVALFLWCFRPAFVDRKFFLYLKSGKAAPLYEKQGKYAEAYQNYQTALRIRPGDTVNIFNLGNLYLKLGNLPAAEAEYLRALKICPYNVDALFNLAYLYQQQGADQKALVIYQQVLQYQPRSPDVHYRMAQIYQGRGDCEKANQHFDLIIRQQPILREAMAKEKAQCR